MKNDAVRWVGGVVRSSSAVLCAAVVMIWLPVVVPAQISTGSDGHDGVFNPMTNTVVNMADHPDGIYQYASVNIPDGVTVTFITNANNTPVVWLVQGDCVIYGSVDVSGRPAPWSGAFPNSVPGQGGPGGGAGGYGASGSPAIAFRGAGYGGGEAADRTPPNYASFGGSGSYATAGTPNSVVAAAPGLVYGNKYLLPLVGGSGGGGGMDSGYSWAGGGGGGGGAVLIASDSSIRVEGRVVANGGGHEDGWHNGGVGSGGGVRLAAPRIFGTGTLSALGGVYSDTYGYYGSGGAGYVRLDVLSDQFVGTLGGSASRGFNPILIAPVNQNVSLAIQSIGGNVVPGNPRGAVTTPDVAIPAQQNNPIPIVVRCRNIPLNTPITVVVKPTDGPRILAGGFNTTGTLASSAGTILVNTPRGGGLISATAVVGVGGGMASLGKGEGSVREAASYAQTGLVMGGERFTGIEVAARLGGAGEITYITQSGKRYSPCRN